MGIAVRIKITTASPNKTRGIRQFPNLDRDNRLSED